MERIAASPALSRASSGAARLPVLGAIVAGGESRRFGSAKGLARVGGTALVERAAGALREVVDTPVIITHLPELAARAGLPTRADAAPGAGPMGGVEAALSWAAELGLPGALCLACDLPFLPSSLLRDVALRGLEGGAAAVLPESSAAGTLEPLAAWYATSTLPELRVALRGGDRSLARLALSLGAGRLPYAEVARHGEPGTIFLNVNTPEGQRAAEALAAGQTHG